MIKNIDELIKTLECDELKFLESLEPKYEQEIEIDMSKKHCLKPDIPDKNEDLN